MSEPTPRQVLYSLVAGGFLVVIAVLIVGGAVAGLVPAWWTATMSIILVVIGAWSFLNWRRTAPVLLMAIGLFLLWAIGTLITA